MRGSISTPAQVKYLLHEGRLSKREASKRLASIPTWRERNAGPDAPVTADLPHLCARCNQSFWMDTLISVNYRTLVCSECHSKAL